MVTDGTPGSRAELTVASHVPSHSSDDRALDTSLRFRSRRECKCQSSGDNQKPFHVCSPMVRCSRDNRLRCRRFQGNASCDAALAIAQAKAGGRLLWMLQAASAACPNATAI